MKPTSPIIKITAALFSLAVLAGCNNAQNSADSSSADLKARQDLMKQWRGANETLKGMSENPANFNADRLKEQAQLLSSTSATMWTHFKDESVRGDTQDALWTDKAGFDAKAAEFDAAVAELLAASQNASQISDVDAAIGKVSESCGSCHKAYKK